MKHIQILIIFTVLLTSCVPDHEIRALYEERPCPQTIIFNSQVSCKVSQPITDVSAMTLEESIHFKKGDRIPNQTKPERVVDVSMTLEQSVQFQKPKKDCNLPHDLAPVKWEVAVFFDYNKSFLTQAAKHKLNDNIWVLKHKPGMNISVRGYTDSRGSHSYNKALAKRRSNSVKKYLIQHGISMARISIDPIGESLPLLKEITEEDMATNRRVEMLLVNDHFTPIPCILLTQKLKESIQIKKFIDRDIYCSLWKKKLTWNSGVEFTSDLTRLTQEDETKLNDNIYVLQQFPDYLISIRDFSWNQKNYKRDVNPIQYIYNYLQNNQIDRNRIQVAKPAKDKSDHKRSTYCVEILLLDQKARPMSLITTVRNAQ